jgi:transcriptional regulator with XRE-family HTH domain
MEQSKKDIHIGKIVKAYLQQKNIAQAVVARRLNITNNMIMYYLNQPHFNTKKLVELSELLKRNLFADIAQHLPEHYTKTQPEVTALQEKITALEHQNELLTSQLNLLKELMRKD